MQPKKQHKPGGSKAKKDHEPKVANPGTLAPQSSPAAPGNLPALNAAYRQVFNTPAGLQVLGDLQNNGFIHTSTHVPGDPNGTAMNEGTRRIVLHIQNMLRVEPDQMPRQVIREQGRGT